MGKRLSKIYTRTGDGGETGLGDGSRISKTAARVQAMGDIDELNACVGLVIVHAEGEALAGTRNFLQVCQHRIFDLGGEVSIPGFALIEDRHVTAVEQALDELNADLEPLENFIMPGGSLLIAQCHHARSVCRRAERSLVALAGESDVNEPGLRYLNRLSDYLFVVARYAAKATGVPEVLWQKDGSAPS